METASEIKVNKKWQVSLRSNETDLELSFVVIKWDYKYLGYSHYLTILFHTFHI